MVKGTTSKLRNGREGSEKTRANPVTACQGAVGGSEGSPRSLDLESRRRFVGEERINRAVVVHAFNPSTWEAVAGGSLSLRPAWSTE